MYAYLRIFGGTSGTTAQTRRARELLSCNYVHRSAFSCGRSNRPSCGGCETHRGAMAWRPARACVLCAARVYTRVVCWYRRYTLYMYECTSTSALYTHTLLIFCRSRTCGCRGRDADGVFVFSSSRPIFMCVCRGRGLCDL